MFCSAVIAALSVLPLVSAQTQNITFLTGLLQTLQSAGLTALASVSSQINSTTTGQHLLAELSSGNNYTVFAPNNDAFAAGTVGDNDANLLADVMSYHVVSGSFVNYSTTYPNTTIGRTFLNDTTYVTLEGNRAQVVAWAVRGDGSTHVLNQVNDSVVESVTSYENVNIYVVNHVISFPGNLTQTATNNSDVSSIVSLAEQVQIPVYDPSQNQTVEESLLGVLNGLQGFTLFAPSSAALANAASSLSSLTSNQTATSNVFRNHLLNGTTVYSPSFIENNYTSASGEPLLFTTNSTGTFVTSNNITARIIQPDVLIKNGVVHVIDVVLVNTDSDESAASSAYQSATSAAGQSVSETGPVGAPTATGGSSDSNGAMGIASVSVNSAVIALICAAIGGFTVLL